MIFHMSCTFHSINEIWYVLCTRNVVDSWCARHVMKYVCSRNVVDSWCDSVPVMWWILGGVPAL